MQTSDTVELLKELIRRKSITPNDDGCQEIIGSRLAKLGFTLTPIICNDVHNLFAIKGDSYPILGFAGHTDVVPPGNIEEWSSHPFKPTIRNGALYGRGTADMKGGLAAMVTAVERFIGKYPDHKDSIAFLITSDEEGIAEHGTLKILEYMKQQGISLQACIIGEPTSKRKLGDTIKHGRRGSLTGKLIVHGIQGHVAYPNQAENPIHRLGLMIHELTTNIWDQGNDFFPPTSFQISNISGGAGVDNVIPSSTEIMFNFRYSTELSPRKLENMMISILNKFNFCYELQWLTSHRPFLTKTGTFINSCMTAIHDITGISPSLSTDGGTSDGRYIAPTGAHVIELGPCNQSIHSVNENVNLEDLNNLSLIYERILEITLLRVKNEKICKKLSV